MFGTGQRIALLESEFSQLKMMMQSHEEHEMKAISSLQTNMQAAVVQMAQINKDNRMDIVEMAKQHKLDMLELKHDILNRTDAEYVSHIELSDKVKDEREATQAAIETAKKQLSVQVRLSGTIIGFVIVGIAWLFSNHVIEFAQPENQPIKQVLLATSTSSGVL